MERKINFVTTVNEYNEIIVSSKEVAVTDDDNIILKTFGISTCLGILIINEDRRILFHINAQTSLSEVRLILLELIDISKGTKVFFVTGNYPYIDYDDLKKILYKMIPNVSIEEFHSDICDVCIDFCNDKIVYKEDERKTKYKLK